MANSGDNMTMRNPLGILQSGRESLGLLCLLIGLLVGQAFAQAPGRSAAAPGSEESVEELFKDFLHYAVIGNFTLADSRAQMLLAHPELDPEELLDISTRHKTSIDTLLNIIAHSSIAESARKVLDVIDRGEALRRKDPERIRINIQRLGGHPQMVDIAIRNLIRSGEYAVPHLVQTLLDPAQRSLWTRVINALPRLGKGAVNPMVIALNVSNEDVRQNLIHAVGEYGYPQAIPYLKKLTVSPDVTQETRDAANAAISRIETLVGRRVEGTLDELFTSLGEQYYNEDDAVRADPTLDGANVWYWDSDAQELQATVVVTKIFAPVMAMRCAEEALLARNDNERAISLWLAADIRREARQGMNIESDDPDEVGEADATRPTPFPRALYFTQAAGPRYAHLVLARAVSDRDSAVALGAIAALRVTAGETSLVGTEDFKQPLAESLRFPDTLVRIRAALALGAALPRSPFEDSQFVVAVLASTITAKGHTQLLVVDPDEQNRNRVVAALRGEGREVVGSANFYDGLDRARTEFESLSGVFLATDIDRPNVADAVQALRQEFLFAKAPLVILTKPTQSQTANDVAQQDRFAVTVRASAEQGDLNDALDRVARQTDQTVIDQDLAAQLALEAAEVLREIAVDGRAVYDVSEATPSLIAALSSDRESLQTTAADVLSLIPTPQAQRAIAHVALDGANAESLRVAVFAATARSAKMHGSQLDEKQIERLIEIAKGEENLVIRTAASQTLGAVNLATSKASEIIRSYYGG